MAPATLSITVGKNIKKTIPIKSVEATIEGNSSVKFILSPWTSDEFCCAMWNVKVVHEKDSANMELVNKTVTSKMPSTTERNMNPVIKCIIPCAVNFKEIKEHEELVLFKPKIHVEKNDKRSSIVLSDKREANKVKTE